MAWRTNQCDVSFDNLRVAGSPASYNTLVYLHGDHLGSIGAVTNSSGALLDMTRFLPFGGYRGSDPAFLTERGFTGHKMNNRASNDLGLIYMGARFYVPSIGRFASADVIIPNPTNPQSHNRYSYVYNNPLRFRDADGHRPCEFLCPGEWIPNGSFTGSAWYGPWDIQKQRENSARAQSLIVNFVSTTVGIVWEPADWAIALSDGVQWYDGLGMLPLVPAAFGDNIGRAAARLIPAGWSDNVGRAVGHWDNLPAGTLSQDWARYQAHVTGVEGMEFIFNGVKFDGVIGSMNAAGNIDNLVLLDAKHWSEGFVKGMVYGNNAGAYESKILQARQQIAAANGVRIQWHFSDEAAANLWRDALRQAQIHGIDVIYTPWAP